MSIIFTIQLRLFILFYFLKFKKRQIKFFFKSKLHFFLIRKWDPEINLAIHDKDATHDPKYLN